MTTTGLRLRVPIIVGAFITFITALLTHRWMDGGSFPARVPWLTPVLLVAMAVAVLVVGWAVRSYQRGEKADLNPLRAARTLALAQAAALTGAAVGGFYLGQAIAVLPDRDLTFVTDLLWRLGATVLASIGVVAAGMVAQAWCRIRPKSDAGGDGEPPAPTSTSTPAP